MALAFDVGSIFTFKEVSVVQSIDAAALQALLSQLLNKQTAVEDQLREQQQEIEALRGHKASDTQVKPSNS